MAQKEKLPAFKTWGQRRFRRAEWDSPIDAKIHRADGPGEPGSK
jgi:hypothetical protein